MVKRLPREQEWNRFRVAIEKNKTKNEATDNNDSSNNNDNHSFFVFF